ncbi:hypothetical protein M5D96_002230, partial [Drosophila gunungcola]
SIVSAVIGKHTFFCEKVSVAVVFFLLFYHIYVGSSLMVDPDAQRYRLSLRGLNEENSRIFDNGCSRKESSPSGDELGNPTNRKLHKSRSRTRRPTSNGAVGNTGQKPLKELPDGARSSTSSGSGSGSGSSSDSRSGSSSRSSSGSSSGSRSGSSSSPSFSPEVKSPQHSPKDVEHSASLIVKTEPNDERVDGDEILPSKQADSVSMSSSSDSITILSEIGNISPIEVVGSSEEELEGIEKNRYKSSGSVYSSRSMKDSPISNLKDKSFPDSHGIKEEPNGDYNDKIIMPRVFPPIPSSSGSVPSSLSMKPTEISNSKDQSFPDSQSLEEEPKGDNNDKEKIPISPVSSSNGNVLSLLSRTSPDIPSPCSGDEPTEFIGKMKLLQDQSDSFDSLHINSDQQSRETINLKRLRNESPEMEISFSSEEETGQPKENLEKLRNESPEMEISFSSEEETGQPKENLEKLRNESPE